MGGKEGPRGGRGRVEEAGLACCEIQPLGECGRRYMAWTVSSFESGVSRWDYSRGVCWERGICMLVSCLSVLLGIL